MASELLNISTEGGYLSVLCMLLMISFVVLTGKSTSETFPPLFLDGFSYSSKAEFSLKNLYTFEEQCIPHLKIVLPENSQLTSNLYEQLQQLALHDSRAIK